MVNFKNEAFIQSKGQNLQVTMMTRWILLTIQASKMKLRITLFQKKIALDQKFQKCQVFIHQMHYVQHCPLRTTRATMSSDRPVLATRLSESRLETLVVYIIKTIFKIQMKVILMTHTIHCLEICRDIKILIMIALHLP